MEKPSGITTFLGLGIALALGIFSSSVYLGSTFTKLKNNDKTIEVKGFAERKISSDTCVWSGTLVIRQATITEAFTKLEQQKKEVFSYLKGEDIQPDTVTLSPVSKETVMQIDEKGNSTNVIDSFVLRQRFSLTSHDVHKIAALATKIDQINATGIEFESQQPEYFYTSDKLNQVKVELLGEATKSAKERAMQLAENSGSSVGQLVNARQGIFQVTSENSTDMSDYGIYDTSTIEKVVKIVVTLSYTIN